MTRRRSVAVWALIVLASLLALVSALTVWSKQQLLDTDKFTSSSAKLLANDEIRATLSNRLVDLLNQRVDVQAQLEEKLPPRAKGAAPAIAAAIQNSTGQVINAFLGTAQAQALWERINRRAHGALVNVLEGKDAGAVSTANGDVVLDLRPLIQRVAERLGVGDRLKQRAPPDAGEIVLLKSNQLDAAQKGVRVLNALSSWLWLAVVALLALAVYLAHGTRRTMLEAVGLALLIVGVLLLIIRRFVGDAIVDSLVNTESSKPAVHAIWLIETDLLRDVALALVFYGLFALIAGIVAGPSRPAVAVRRGLAPTWRDRPVLVWITATVLFLVFIAWGPSGGSRRLLGVLILAALLGLGLEVWRRQTLSEFPESVEAPDPAAAAVDSGAPEEASLPQPR
ncbi:MAG: hypothetical protein E6G26_05700 [Actinobacteria bacterium]|nr:MAG: hypothetical protein E6G26_05700 [Actinomycetota bacterium]